MFRGFRHTLFLLLQVGVVISGGIAVIVYPNSWPAILICVLGAVLATLVCDRIARRYLRSTLGRLRRLADDISSGKPAATIDVQPGEDLYKLANAINLVATRLTEARAEEKRLQEQLRRSERLAFLGELAATVAHEVNNPLDGVQNCSRILRRSMDDAERARQMLDLIDSGLGRIDVIVRRLLTLAREHVIRPVEASVTTVVDSAIDAVRTKIESRDIRITRRVEPGDDRASLDPQLLEQVFVNLMLNAADSMADEGELTITVRRERTQPQADKLPAGDAIRVDVLDTGAGIEPEVLPHIFEPFYTTKTQGRGTGLGLPIAARIVDAHRGTVDVAPQSSGGTLFTVRLPALTAGDGKPSRAEAGRARTETTVPASD